MRDKQVTQSGNGSWYRQMGQRYRMAVGGASLRDQCVEAIKRDIPLFLDRLPDLPADLRQLLLPAFLKARMLDSCLLELCTRHGELIVGLCLLERQGTDWCVVHQVCTAWISARRCDSTIRGWTQS